MVVLILWSLACIETCDNALKEIGIGQNVFLVLLYMTVIFVLNPTGSLLPEIQS